jgi:hypothetical protein
VGTDTTRPFVVPVSPALRTGTVRFMARATDNAGNVGTSPIVTVSLGRSRAASCTDAPRAAAEVKARAQGKDQGHHRDGGRNGGKTRDHQRQHRERADGATSPERAASLCRKVTGASGKRK